MGALPAAGEERLDLQADGDGAQQLLAKLLRSNHVPEPLLGGIERLAADPEEPAQSELESAGGAGHQP